MTTYHFCADFDANQDTPFEALHVVLLGVVKYFWRDAVSRVSAEGKQTLKARLTSVNVSGLDISPLRAQTLVQYAGSLVGRDFRAILQVAPVVLHGLIPSAAYEAWLALCRLAPMVFQPCIEDMTEFLVSSNMQRLADKALTNLVQQRLESRVYDFLAATALWTTRWFNKPKFHLFLHLAEHIRRFGPATLCSTEGFESYNFIIRLRSVHSNRHAPSKDIANSFSFLHAVRHLVSGGWYHRNSVGERLDMPRQAGDGVLSLLQDDVLVNLLGMNGLRCALAGTITPVGYFCGTTNPYSNLPMKGSAGKFIA